MILYFSATGNTKWVAQQLSTFISDSRIYSLTNIETDIFETLEPDEPLGFCFPVHAWGIPEPVMRFISCFASRYHTPYIYMVCTCGDDCGKTHVQFRKLLQKNGHEPRFMASVQMPNTYINLPGFDVDSVEVIEQKKQKAAEWVSTIGNYILERKQGVHITEGAFPVLKSSLLKSFFKRFLVKDSYFRVTDKCVGCATCVQHCPMNNMIMELDKPIWLHNGSCITCMACYHHCPKKAIEFGKYTKEKGQYFYK
ncbi:MAG: EFR1 family ferrodoxin [Bacteroidaceae bacterium]|nr:EFR1 family ferrodoxin [Bacteroidaceae bacterium]